MRYKLLLLAAVVALCIGGILFDYSRQYSQSINPAGSNLTPRRIVPDFVFRAMRNNQLYHIADFKNKTVIINFWASWCLPCRIEFPDLLNLARAHPDQLALIMLSEDSTAKKANDFARGFFTPSNAYIAWDGRRMAQNIFQTFRYPESIVVSSGGMIQRKIIGQVSDEDIKEIAISLDDFKNAK